MPICFNSWRTDDWCYNYSFSLFSSSEFTPRAVKPHALGDDSDDDERKDPHDYDGENYHERNAENYRKPRSRGHASKDLSSGSDQPPVHYRWVFKKAEKPEPLPHYLKLDENVIQMQSKPLKLYTCLISNSRQTTLSMSASSDSISTALTSKIYERSL